MSMFSDLEKQPAQLKRKEIQVEEWDNGKFYLLELSGSQHSKVAEHFSALFEDGKGPRDSH